MRSNGFRILVAVGLFTALAASAYAQQDGVMASVPFEFVVSGTSFPAGSYIIRRASADQPAFLVLRSEDTDKQVKFTQADFNFHESGEKLIFHRYGDRYFLREVWTPMGRHQLSESKEEVRLSRGSQQPEVTTVAGGR